MPLDDEEISAAALGGWLGLSARAVRDLAARGVLSRNGRGKYGLKPSVQRYLEFVRAAARVPADASLADAKRRRQEALAALAEMDLAQRQGRLVDLAECGRVWQAHSRAVRDDLLTLPSRLQALLPHMPRNDVAALDRLLREMLTRIGTDGPAGDPHAPRRTADG